MVKNNLPEWMAREAQPEGEETGACRDYDDFFSRTRYTVPEGVLDENGRMDAFNNDLVIRCLDKVFALQPRHLPRGRRAALPLKALEKLTVQYKSMLVFGMLLFYLSGN